MKACLDQIFTSKTVVVLGAVLGCSSNLYPTRERCCPCQCDSGGERTGAAPRLPLLLEADAVVALPLQTQTRFTHLHLCCPVCPTVLY